MLSSCGLSWALLIAISRSHCRCVFKRSKKASPDKPGGIGTIGEPAKILRNVPFLLYHEQECARSWAPRKHWPQAYQRTGRIIARAVEPCCTWTHSCSSTARASPARSKLLPHPGKRRKLTNLSGSGKEVMSMRLPLPTSLTIVVSLSGPFQGRPEAPLARLVRACLSCELP